MRTLNLFAFILITFYSNSQIPSYLPSNGLAGWWPFNGNANDESGNGNHGTVNGANLTGDRFGNINNAYEFDGISSYINIPTSTNLNLIGDFSISSWIKLTSSTPTNSHQFIMSKNAGLTGQGTWHLALESQNSLPYQVHYNADPCFCLATMGGSLSQIDNVLWHQVIVTYTSITNELEYFIDGNLVYSSTQFDYQNQVTAYDLLIGKENVGIQGFFNGKLDDIGIWNRALNDCEIHDLFQSQLNSAAGINAGQDQIVCEGDYINLTGSGGSNYIWNNSIVDGVPFIPTASQDYSLLGQNANGCVGTDTVSVTISANSFSSQTQTALDSYSWPVNNQTYTQSGIYTDTLLNAAGCDSVITLNLSLEFTGVDEQNVMTILVHPNPITNSFSISGIEQLVSLSLKDMSGKLIKTLDVQENNYSVSTLTSGVYFLEVRDENRTYMIKVIME